MVSVDMLLYPTLHVHRIKSMYVCLLLGHSIDRSREEITMISESKTDRGLALSLDGVLRQQAAVEARRQGARRAFLLEEIKFTLGLLKRAPLRAQPVLWGVIVSCLNEAERLV